MGEAFAGGHRPLKLKGETFAPKIVFDKKKEDILEKYYFHEYVL